MEGNLQEAKTIPSVSYADKFFTELPNDARFGSVNWNKFVPVNGADKEMKTFSFSLPKMTAPNVYLVRIFFRMIDKEIIIKILIMFIFTFNFYYFLAFKRDDSGNHSHHKSRQSFSTFQTCGCWSR